MSSHWTATDSRDLVVAALDAFHRGDLPEMERIWAPDLVWHLAGRGRLSGDYVGRDAFFAFAEGLLTESGGTFFAELHDVTASDEHAVLLSRATAQRSGRSLDVLETLVFHVRDGQIAECWDSKFDQASWDAFWA